MQQAAICLARYMCVNKTFFSTVSAFMFFSTVVFMLYQSVGFGGC